VQHQDRFLNQMSKGGGRRFCEETADAEIYSLGAESALAVQVLPI
jgi:hypothetical protein